MTYFLKITSWADRSGGRQTCEHFYGRIQPGSIDLEHEIGLRDPLYADCSIRCMTAKPGEKTMTVRFATKDEVVAAGRQWMSENAKPFDDLEIIDGGKR